MDVERVRWLAEEIVRLQVERGEVKTRHEKAFDDLYGMRDRVLMDRSCRLAPYDARINAATEEMIDAATDV